jgi:hypothetical protein
MVKIQLVLCAGANNPSDRDSTSRNFTQGLFAPMNSSEQPKKRQLLCHEIKQHEVHSGQGQNDLRCLNLKPTFDVRMTVHP